MAKTLLMGNPVTTNGDLPALSTSAPDFILVDAELKNHSLKDYAGKRKILSIVPSIDTAVCSLSTKKFNESAKNLPGTVVLVISADLPFAQKRFCGAENIKEVITLSMMRSKDFAKDYGVLLIDGPLAGICARAIVILDENNKVIYTELCKEISQEPNYEKALQVLSV
jgi:thiol peroxidase